MAYDYGFMGVEEHIGEGKGYGNLYVGYCRLCKRRWSTAAMDMKHGTDNMKVRYRNHQAPGSSRLCPAGVATLSADYERYKLGIRTAANEPSSRYNR